MKLQCPYYPCCSCALANSAAYVFDVVFHFWMLLTQTSLGTALDAWAYKEDSTKNFLFYNQCFFFFSSHAFLFIMDVKEKEMKVYTHIVV